MDSKEQLISPDGCSSHLHKCDEKKITSISKAMPLSSETSESNTEILNASAFSSKTSTSPNSFEKLNPLLNSVEIKGQTDDMDGSKQCISKPIQCSSSSNLLGQPFDCASKASHHGYGHPPFRDSKPYQTSGHMPTPYETRGRNFHLGPQNSPGPPFRDSKPYQTSGQMPTPYETRGRNFHLGPQTSSGPPFRDSKSYQISGHMPTPYETRNRNSHSGPQISSEFARGPRANKVHFPASEQKDEVGPLIRRDQFNRSDFEIKYQLAKFFMIKSFSEDDIHKSIKYNVWASTSSGNWKLETAFRDAQRAADSVSIKCPLFLFFSVNASGQFVGLAEMIGPVDFSKTMEFWHNGKWHGFFPVKWHIIKDIPNKYFYNITLENNENKSVTFSRDTQEIGLPQGLKMLQYFKSFPLARSLLDDFDFYEKREKLQNDQRRHAEMKRNHNTFPEHLEAGFGKMSLSDSPEF